MSEPLRYQPLSREHPDWGSVALLPWDAETFGFSAADFRPGSSRLVAPHHTAFQDQLADWAARNGVEVVVCTVPPEDQLWLSLLPRLDFIYFDYTLVITLRLQASSFSTPRMPVRLAEACDQPEVERIAEQVFKYGRYHADPYVPRALANGRYRNWLRNLFAASDEKSRMYVAGHPGTVRGFCHAMLEDDRAQVTLAGVDEPFQRGITGFSLLTGAFEDLKKAGIRRLTSKISASNLGILNLTAAFGFRYSSPQAVFYWHAPGAAYLLTPDEVFT